MSLWVVLAVASVLQSQQVELQTLSGETRTGSLTQLTPDAAVVKTPDGEVSISSADLLELTFVGREAKRLPRQSLRVTLTDASYLSCSTFSSTARNASLDVPGIGTTEIPVSALASVRFQPLDATVKKSWEDLLQRELKSDTLVIRKAEVLDFLPGVIGDVDDQSVKFLLDGEELTLPREKVFGLIYYRRSGRKPSRSVCGVSLATGDLLNARSVELQEDKLLTKLSAGGTLNIPVTDVRSLDFSQGKVVYLSSMEPRDVKYVSYFDIVWKYRRDQNLDGGPIRLFGKSYSRGLAIHSRTTLKYRLRGDYRRFKAVMGIDESLEGGGDVHVVISADGKTIYEADVTGRDKQPHLLDLDIADVRDLEILVDFGGDLAIADHLDLADARVIK